MAELISEDSDCPSRLVIKPIEDKQLPGLQGEVQHWQLLSIELVSGKRTLSTLHNEETMICRTPTDEIALLSDQLRQLIAGQREQVLFEPSEPSFELSFARTRRSGIKVEVWLDAGNGTTGIYTWDASGIRFMTTEAHLLNFVESVEQAFPTR